MPEVKLLDFVCWSSMARVEEESAMRMSVRVQWFSMDRASKRTTSGASGRSRAQPVPSVQRYFCASNMAAQRPTGPAPTMAIRRRLMQAQLMFPASFSAPRI